MLEMGCVVESTTVIQLLISNQITHGTFNKPIQFHTLDIQKQKSSFQTTAQIQNS